MGRVLGRWVLNAACRQFRAWRDAGIAPPLVAVNLSLSELKSGSEFVREVAATIEKWGLRPSDFEFDVTEAALAQTRWAADDVLPQLRELGVQIAIDDFGAEFSSIGYLRTYGVNHLKITRTLISKVTEDPRSAATIAAIINLAHEVGIGVIAEGVETQAQRDMLAGAGCATEAQGFYFSAAVGVADASELLRQGGIGANAHNDAMLPVRKRALS